MGRRERSLIIPDFEIDAVLGGLGFLCRLKKKYLGHILTLRDVLVENIFFWKTFFW